MNKTYEKVYENLIDAINGLSIVEAQAVVSTLHLSVLRELEPISDKETMLSIIDDMCNGMKRIIEKDYEKSY